MHVACCTILTLLLTGGGEHDFYVKVATYRPGVITDWGEFGPSSVIS